MSKLFYIQFLFIYILLFHFVANKEKFYIKIKETKWEFDLYTNTIGGSSFYQLLKEKNNDINPLVMNNEDNLYIEGEISFSFNKSTIEVPIIGSIIVDDAGKQLLTFLLVNSSEDWDDAEKIGQIIHSVDFANYIKNLNLEDIEVQFILEEEKPKKNLKTLKIMERNIILKRMIKMNQQYNWKNIGWKSLDSFKSLLKYILK